MNLVIKTYTGRVSTRCVLQLLDDIEADPNFREGMMEFDDLTDVSDLAITATEIEKFAELLTGVSKRKRRPTRKSVLAPRGSARAAAFGFSALVQDSNYLEIGVFDTLSDALDFLGFDAESGVDQSVVSAVRVH